MHVLWDPSPTLCTGTDFKLTSGIVQPHSLELRKNHQESCPIYSKRDQLNRNIKKKSLFKKTENTSQTLEHFIPLKGQSLFLLEKGKKRVHFCENILPICAAKVSETCSALSKYCWGRKSRLGGSFNLCITI